MAFLLACAVMFVGADVEVTVPKEPARIMFRGGSLQHLDDQFYFHLFGTFPSQATDVDLTTKWDKVREYLRFEKTTQGVTLRRSKSPDNTSDTYVYADFSVDPPQIKSRKELSENCYWELVPVRGSKERRFYIRNLTPGKEKCWLAPAKEDPRRVFRNGSNFSGVCAATLIDKPIVDFTYYEVPIGK